MNNQYVETMNNHRPSLTMWQYYWRAWTFPKEKRASRTEATKVTWGMLLSSMILGFFIIVIIDIIAIFGHGVGDTSSFGGRVAAILLFTLYIGSIFFYLQLFTVPGIPLFIRRVHDSGKSAWLPFIGAMLLWPVYLYFMKKEGDPGTNKFGPPPSL